ncbi:MAG: efflux RND transporter periplasmic adaptor subunit [Alphaproteobacteria bacterium]|nr:efflux RND transporter periplasmic adaptor subunit [Alphaproteobacteria bacterium]
MAGFPTIRLALATALLAGCGAKESPRAAPERPRPVRLVTVGLADASARLEVSGTVRLKRETALSFNAPGRIAAIFVQEGDRVRAGQLLARLDTTALGANVAAARAEVVRAQADVKRAEDLFAKGWVTAPRVEQARATMVAAVERARAAGFDVQLAALVAPSAGVVLARPGEPGQIAQPGVPVVTLGELGQGFVLQLPLADRDAARVRPGQRAEVTIPALGRQPLAAVVSEVGARGDDGTGTFRIELKLPADARLASGQIGTAQLVLGPAQAGAPLLVPASAVFAARADEGFVFVLEPATRRVRQRLVMLGTVSDAGVVVTAGLQPGELVVATGLDRLRDGALVAAATAAVGDR